MIDIKDKVAQCIFDYQYSGEAPDPELGRTVVELVKRELLASVDQVDQFADLHKEPDPDDSADRLSHRAMSVIKEAFDKEFEHDELVPNVTIVVAAPPDGRVGIASTEQDPRDILLALRMGWGVVKKSVRLRAGRQ